VYNLGVRIYLGVYMERMTLKAYAVKHKLSIFNVMKMLKSDKVKSEVFQEKGREVTYILYDEESEREIEEQIIPIENKEEVQVLETLRVLTQEVQALRKEVEVLKRKL
jgi:Cft2 family RNA processing exonuclease